MQKHALTPEEQEQKKQLEKAVRDSNERLKLFRRQERLHKKLNRLEEEKDRILDEIDEIKRILAEPND